MMHGPETFPRLVLEEILVRDVPSPVPMPGSMSGQQATRKLPIRSVQPSTTQRKDPNHQPDPENSTLVEAEALPKGGLDYCFCILNRQHR